MRIIKSDGESYAYIEWDEADETLIQQLQRESDRHYTNIRIEVSPEESIPDEIRGSLRDGRFLVIE